MHVDFFNPEPHLRLRWAHATPTSPQAAIVLCHGRTEFIEKYYPLIQRLVAMNFEVFTLDWRGQGGSTRLLTDPLKGHLESLDDLVLDLHLFMQEVVTPRRISDRVALLAHSLGGHVALRYLYHHPTSFQRAAVTAPVIAPCHKLPFPILGQAARLMVRLGRGEQYVIGPSDPFALCYEDNRYTSDIPRFEQMMSTLRDHPDHALGAITWGFLKALYDSSVILDQPDHARRIHTPLLVATAGQDEIVDTPSALRFAAMLPDATLYNIPESMHEILMERDEYLEPFLESFRRFVMA